MNTFGRAPYVVLFFFISVVAFILRNYAHAMLQWIPILSQFCENEQTCYGVFAVYRLCFTLAVFFLALALIMIGVSHEGDFRVGVQNGWWGLKIILFAGLLVGAFFIPNPFFTYFGWVALGFAAIFVFIQLIYLVDFAHGLAEFFHEKADQSDNNNFMYLMAGITGGCYLLILVGTILFYVFFGHDSLNCGTNIAFITINVVFGIASSALSIHSKVQEKNPRMGLLQSATVFTYTTYLIFSAMMSDTSECNPWANSSSASNTGVVIGSLFAIIAVVYGAFSTGSRTEDGSETQPLTKEEKEDKAADDAADKEDGIAVKEDRSGIPVTYSFTKFHLMFALGAMYLAMLMSDWHTISGTDPENLVIDMGAPSYWVKIVSTWICYLLYLWTILAPVCFPDRDFGYKSDTAWA